MTLATRIAVMDQGQFMQIGTPAEIYENPRSRFIANFIGSANLIDGTVTECQDQFATIKLANSNQTLVVGIDEPLVPGNEVSIAIRPEKIRIEKTKPAAGTDNVMFGSVREMAYLGRLSIYHIVTDNGSVLEVTAPNQTRYRDGQHAVDWEDEVYLSFDPDAAIVLND